jgi:hypothetical protein
MPIIDLSRGPVRYRLAGPVNGAGTMQHSSTRGSRRRKSCCISRQRTAPA